MGTFNAKIVSASITMEDYGCLTWRLSLEGKYILNIGGYCIGNGYLGADYFEGSAKGTESLMRVMDTVGVERWEDLPGKYVRVVEPSSGGIVTRFGHIYKEKWFDLREFFSEEGE